MESNKCTKVFLLSFCLSFSGTSDVMCYLQVGTRNVNNINHEAAFCASNEQSCNAKQQMGLPESMCTASSAHHIGKLEPLALGWSRGTGQRILAALAGRWSLIIYGLPSPFRTASTRQCVAIRTNVASAEALCQTGKYGMEMCVRYGKTSITLRVMAAANRILQLDMRNGGRVDCVDCKTWGSIFIGLRVDCMPQIVSFGAEYSWPLTTEAVAICRSKCESPYGNIHILTIYLHVSGRSKAFLTYNEVICRHTFYDCTIVHVQFKSNL